MAIDRMPTAEDLIRRALTQEATDGNVHMHTYIHTYILINLLSSILFVASKFVEQKTTGQCSSCPESGITYIHIYIDTYIHTYTHYLQAANAIEEYQKILSAPEADSGASEEGQGDTHIYTNSIFFKIRISLLKYFIIHQYNDNRSEAVQVRSCGEMLRSTESAWQRYVCMHVRMCVCLFMYMCVCICVIFCMHVLYVSMYYVCMQV